MFNSAKENVVSHHHHSPSLAQRGAETPFSVQFSEAKAVLVSLQVPACHEFSFAIF